MLGVVAAAAAPAFAQPAAPVAAVVLGEPPTYLQRPLSEVPNAAAIRTRIWSPGLDDGWVPQGVAVGGGYLYVGDARTLYRIDTDAALAAGKCEPPACAAIALPRAWRADALAYRDGMLWFATHAARGAGTGRMVQVSQRDVLARADGGDGAPDERAARRALPIADQTQGAAVAADGSLWLTQSDGKCGRLQKVDPETGMVMASYAMPAGIEDVEFAPGGRLWTVSEAGSRRWSSWRTFYPLVFSVDPGMLR